MPVGIEIRDETGKVVFDTNDRVAGGLVTYTIGPANGSRTAPLLPGQSVEFIYTMPVTFQPSGTASPWPSISIIGNTISWSYNATVPTVDRAQINVIEVYY